MIPKSIQYSNVIAALEEIDRSGVPFGRQSRKFHLIYRDRRYPPKYVLSLAHRFQSGRELSSEAFGGGDETNSFLRGLGFLISSGLLPNPQPIVTPVTLSGAIPTPREARQKPSVRVTARHSERCPDCKIAVERLLRVLYRQVEENPKIIVPTTPDAYGSMYRDALAKIYSALKLQRGFTSFVRSETLPRCDFLVGSPGFLVEFDESQHFTQSRRLALSLYPDSLPLGFNRPDWMRRCEEIDRRDNDPPYRDEQRAWYDTLRDFLPFTKEMLPTIRFWEGEHTWCDFNLDKAEDVESFRQILEKRASLWNIQFAVPEKPLLARVAIDGDWRGDLGRARKLLKDVCAKWPRNLRVLSLSTCGAFVRVPWPSGIDVQSNNFNPSGNAVRELDACARSTCELLLSDGLRGELAKHADFLTVGIDTNKANISKTENAIVEEHAEMVYVSNLRTGHLHFTGKSYPTLKQEKTLLRIADLQSHFVDMDGTMVMVLGCHDLTMFNRRSDASVKQPQRAAVKGQFKALCDIKRPSVVLHHPHTTIKVSTWRDAWDGVRLRVPTVQSYLGTGCYSYKDDWSKRHPLSQVLEKTKSPDVADIIVQLAGCPNSMSPHG